MGVAYQKDSMEMRRPRHLSPETAALAIDPKDRT